VICDLSRPREACDLVTSNVGLGRPLRRDPFGRAPRQRHDEEVGVGRLEIIDGRARRQPLKPLDAGAVPCQLGDPTHA
jgi:hypothetical protein